MDRFDRIVIAILGALAFAVLVETLIGDRAGVGVATISPQDGSAPSITTAIRIEFSQPMDPSSVKERLTFTPDVTGQIRWQGSTLVFTPDKVLEPGQRYDVLLFSGARSVLGRTLNHDVHTTFTPRTPRIVYLGPAQAEKRGLWLVPQTGGEPRRIMQPPNGVDSFAVSPDGSRIAITVNGAEQNADLWLFDPQSEQSTQITRCAPDYCGNASWAPDGLRLAFEKRQGNSGDEGAASQIWLYDIPSASMTPLFEDRGLPGYGPEWSRDGNHLAFFDVQVQAIIVVDLRTGEVTYLPSQMGDVGSFSPDGSQMVYEDFRAIGGQVFTELWIGSTAGDARIVELLADAQEDQFPSWSPDGKWIAFGRRRLDRQGGFGSQMMLFDPATSQLRQVTDDVDYNSTAFAWSPGGDQIIVQRFNLTAASGGGELWLYSLPDDSFSLIASDGYGAAWLP